MQAVAAAGGGGSLQRHGAMQHHSHSMNHVGAAQVSGHYTDRGQHTADEECPDSPGYSQPGYHDSFQYGETSASASNSGEEDDERDYDGKRSGDPLTGLAAKKRRKQSKPIRLGSEEGGEGEAEREGEDEGEGEGEGEVAEEGEITRYRRESGDSEDSPGQGDTPLNLSAVSKQSDDKSESGGEFESLAECAGPDVVFQVSECWAGSSSRVQRRRV